MDVDETYRHMGGGVRDLQIFRIDFAIDLSKDPPGSLPADSTTTTTTPTTTAATAATTSTTTTAAASSSSTTTTYHLLLFLGFPWFSAQPMRSLRAAYAQPMRSLHRFVWGAGSAVCTLSV